MGHERTFVGLDVHARSVVACSIDSQTGEVVRARLTPDHEEVWRWIAGFEGPVAVGYEAGPTGFGLYRALTADGVRCVVVAPSLIPKKPGDRVKTNRRDALNLAKLLRAGELTAVWVPDARHEAMRDLVRAREAAVDDLKSKRQQVLSLLLRLGRHFTGKRTWTRAHMNWLVSQGLTGLPENDLVRGFCERCRAGGLDLSRGLVFIDTLHPIFEGRGFRWHDIETNQPETFEYGSSEEGDAAEGWRRSIF